MKDEDEDEVLLFVLDRGFVVIGIASIYDKMVFTWRLTPGRTVRRWGTTNGLAELQDGPLENTILDPPTNRRIPFRSIIEIHEVNRDKWMPHLKVSSDGQRRMTSSRR